MLHVGEEGFQRHCGVGPGAGRRRHPQGHETPDFFANGKPLTSFGFERLQALVQEELASAYRQQESLDRRISSRFLPPTIFFKIDDYQLI